MSTMLKIKFDKDNNGAIDTYELLSAIIFMSDSTFEEKAQLLFSLYDTNLSTTLDLDELTILMKNALTALMILENKQAPNMNEIDRRTRLFFSTADEDRNNLVSFKEFKTFLKKEPFILEFILKFGVAKQGELGGDFGSQSNQLPTIDEDLDAECKPKGLERTAKQAAVKADIPLDEFTEEVIGSGDQSMGGRHMNNGAIKNAKPDNYKPSKNDVLPPSASLDLEYVFGYRCHDTRNNLRYASDGKLVYHTAAVGIVMDAATNTQKHFIEHRDDILSIAVNPMGTICVTGEIGPKPRLCVWNIQSQEKIEQLIAPLIKGVRHICFSPNGQFIAASDMSDDHNVVIFELLTNKGKDGKLLKKIAFDKGTKANIMSLGFDSTGETLIATCVKEVNFYTWADGKIKCKKGTGWGTTACDTILSQAIVGNILFVGNLGGEIISFAGNSVSKRKKGHSEKVNCLFASTNGLISGGGDGNVCTWTVRGGEITLDKTFSLKDAQIDSANAQVISVCEQNDKILVGTRGGEIVEFQKKTGTCKVHMRSHFDSELWGLACHPTQSKIYTWGRDSMLGVWDLKTRKQICYTKMDTGGDALAISPDGNHLALGFLNGRFLVLDQNLKPIKKVGDRQGKAIQVMKYCPESKILAVGAHDSMIMTYDVKNNYSLLKKIKGHSSTIKFIDFKLDGLEFQSLCQAYEILYFDPISGKQNTYGASANKNEPWASWTLSLGWPVTGIWPPCADGSDINAVERSEDGTVIATADDFSKVKLFKFPCPAEKAKFVEYSGHSSHVTNVSFSRNKTGQKYVLSTGGEDKAIFQWKFTNQSVKQSPVSEQVAQKSAKSTRVNKQEIFEDDEEELPVQSKNVKTTRVVQSTKKFVETEPEEEEDNRQYIDPDDPSNVAKINKTMLKAAKKQQAPNQIKPSKKDKTEDEDFCEAELASGDEFLAVLPWKGQMKPPTDFKKPSKDASIEPELKIQLEWAHGVASISRNNVMFLPNDQVAYYVAGVNVIYDPKTHTQRFFDKHTDDIKTIAFSPDRKYIASGENGKKPVVYVIDSTTLEVKHSFTGHGIQCNVLAVAFSPSGKVLGVVDEHDDHHIAIYNLETGACIAEDKGDKGAIQGIAFENDTTWVTSGPKHFKQYTIKGTKFSGKLGNFGNEDQRIGSCVFNGTDCLTGSYNGDLYKWNGTAIGNAAKKIHSRMIDAITVTNTHVFTGGKDSLINVLDKKYKSLFTIDLSKLQNSISSQVRSITINDKQDCLMLGTFGHELVKQPINLQQNKVTGNATVLIHGHYSPATMITNEAWGLTVFPDQNKYISTSDDGTLRIWDQLTRKQIALIRLDFDKEGNELAKLKDGTLNLSAMARSVDISPDGKYIVCGCRDGSVRSYQGEGSEWSLIDIKRVGQPKKQEWIEDLKFSPNGKYLLVGSHDNFLYLFQVPNFSKVVKTFGKSSSFIQHIDWSLDSSAVRTNDASYELLYYTIPDGKQQTSGATSYKDELWASQNCTLGWNTQGIWQQGMDGSDINYADRSHKPLKGLQYQVIATADDNSKVSLFRYPSVVEHSNPVQGQGHCSHVTKVRFNHDDSYLYSAGGNDTAIFQWKIIPTPGVPGVGIGKEKKTVKKEENKGKK